MKSTSHRTLGRYLIDTYMQDCPNSCVKAFSIGCIQPDKNPTTYFKGSFRWQWMRGHNWDNAKKYIRKVGNRLQYRNHLRMLDYYQLGKLIHYTADAFTYAHNRNCTMDLSAHRDYERDLHARLEEYLSFLTSDHGIEFDPNGSVSDFISTNHKRYMGHRPCIENDMDYCVRMCAQVLQLLLQSKYLVYA